MLTYRILDKYKKLYIVIYKLMKGYIIKIYKDKGYTNKRNYIMNNNI